MKHLQEVRENDKRFSHWVARGPAGTSVEWDAELTQDQANTFLSWRSLPGALRVRGNVCRHEHDGSAEWNSYWDPPAVASLWAQPVPITIVPLDATNEVPVSMAFLQRLARERAHPLADFAGQCWATTVGTIPAYEYVYFMWDTLTTGYLGAPALFRFEAVETVVDVAPPSAGRIRIAPGGRRVRAAVGADSAGFHDWLLGLLRVDPRQARSR